MEDFKTYLAKVANGKSLSRAEAETAFDRMMSGAVTPAQIGGFLMSLRVRGETVDEIVGAVSAMRARMLKVDAPVDAIDIVGTGGDASGSYNVSTCAAFVAAGAGLKVAKHGNRALSSRTGAAEALKELGVNLELSPQDISRCIEEAGIGFMFAPNHHAAMRHVGPARVELGTRTIFNLLGPLSNPAGVKRQMTGVFSPEWVEPLASVLKDLGTEAAWIVHGDGLDELTTAGVNRVTELKDGRLRNFTFEATDFGLPRVALDDLKGGEPAENALALRNVLEGAKNPYRDIVCLNAAAAMVVADKAGDLKEGIDMAAQALDSGASLEALEALVETSNRPVEQNA